MAEEILKKIEKIVNEVQPDFSGDLKPEMNLRKDVGLDSLDVMSFFLELETEFKIKIPDSDFTENIFVVRNLIEYVEKAPRVS